MSNVWFMGRGSRTLTKHDWAHYDIANGPNVEWNPANGWARPTSMFTTQQLTFLKAQKGEFEFDKTGPRARKAPESVPENIKSNYPYYIATKLLASGDPDFLRGIIEDFLKENPDVLAGLIPIRFSSPIAMLGVTATDYAYRDRTLIEARMRVASAPIGSDLVVDVENWDGFVWTLVTTLTIVDGSVTEAVEEIEVDQVIGSMMRCNVLDVGIESAASGVAIDILVKSELAIDEDEDEEDEEGDDEGGEGEGEE